MRHAWRWGAFVLDKDGTLVNGGVAVEGATETIHYLNRTNTPYLILSNTGERTNDEVAGDLSSLLGVVVPTDRVLTARTHMIEEMQYSTRRVRTIGRHDARWQPFLNGEEIPDCCKDVCLAIFSDGDVSDYVETITRAALWIKRGAEVIASSCDSTLTTVRDGVVQTRPGPGVFLNALSTVSDILVPHHVFGKPSTSIGSCVMSLLKRQGFSGSSRRVLMVGDRLDTDVRLGNTHRWSTCLVESGCHVHSEHAPQFPKDQACSIAHNLRDVIQHHQSLEKWDAFVTDVVSHQIPRIRLGLPPRRIRSVPTRLDQI